MLSKLLSSLKPGSDPAGGPGEEIPFSPEELQRLPQRKWILGQAQRGGVGAEIGVFRGHFSAILAEELKPSRLYLVDPWQLIGETFGWGENSPYTGFGKLTTKYAKEDAARRVAKFAQIDVRITEAYAVDFFTALDEKLDWIYLDASHKYAPTLTEIGLAARALKEGGVIIGDDWHANPAHQHHGVYQAVRDFCKRNPYEIVAAGPAAQWCIRKTAS